MLKLKKLNLLLSIVLVCAGCVSKNEMPAPVVDKGNPHRDPYTQARQPKQPHEPVASAVASPHISLAFSETDWHWPAAGSIVATFVPGTQENRGIDIAGTLGAPIRAAKAGKVAFSGAGLTGYGQLIIIRHENNFLSAYAYNSKLLVQEGDTVKANQIIAEMGIKEDTLQPTLHFEIRLQGKPIDPLPYLPNGL